MKNEEALEALTRATELEPESAIAWHLRGRFLFMVGRHEEALRRADAAVAVQPDFAVFHELRAAALRAAASS